MKTQKLLRLAVVVVTVTSGTAFGQECLHGNAETRDQSVRRSEALIAARLINSLQANQPGASKGIYLQHGDLFSSPLLTTIRATSNEIATRLVLTPGEEILPGWKLTLDVTEQGYWFMIRDTLDPCGFTYVSNQNGVILHAEPTR